MAYNGRDRYPEGKAEFNRRETEKKILARFTDEELEAFAELESLIEACHTATKAYIAPIEVLPERVLSAQ